MTNQVTYDCKQCGAEIIVKGKKDTVLQPIYCCGIEAVKRSSAGKKARKARGKTAAVRSNKSGTS